MDLLEIMVDFVDLFPVQSDVYQTKEFDFLISFLSILVFSVNVLLELGVKI